MCTEEITAVVINSDYVTNDPDEIGVAEGSDQPIEYVSRDQARRLARRTRRTQWNVLAEAPAIFVIVDGVRYRRSCIDSPISFSVSAVSVAPLPIIAG